MPSERVDEPTPEELYFTPRNGWTEAKKAHDRLVRQRKQNPPPGDSAPAGEDGAAAAARGTLTAALPAVTPATPRDLEIASLKKRVVESFKCPSSEEAKLARRGQLKRAHKELQVPKAMLDQWVAEGHALLRKQRSNDLAQRRSQFQETFAILPEVTILINFHIRPFAHVDKL